MVDITPSTALVGGAWDTHIHLFNPAKFPFKHDRAYTPGAAHFEELMTASPATNFMVVQASIEEGSEGVLHHLQRLAKTYPDRSFRGTLLLDTSDVDATLRWSPEKLDELHAAGVRCLRVHGELGNLNQTSESFTASLKYLLKGQIAPVVRHRGWAISMQLPLYVWASLGSFLNDELHGIPVIAEHCASLCCPLSDSQREALDDVCHMLQTGNFFIKLGALHRRAAGHSMEELQSCVSKLAAHGPNQLLWGSDWPHVNSTIQDRKETSFLSVDVLEELDRLRRTMSDEVFQAMLRTTPDALFGC